MAKKQKRQVSSAARSEAGPVSVPTYNPNPSVRRVATVEFKPDYSMVVYDLRRIGVLAGSFLVILIVLSFILK